tara:strand:+ start:3089 stop:3730 length:642 start_codon:yes stop_codon:yes gene_type:complete
MLKKHALSFFEWSSSLVSPEPQNVRHQSRSRALVIVFSAFFVLITSGCGYHLGHGAGNPTGSTLHVDIPMFQNKTSEPKLGLLVTRGIKDAMLKTPGIQVVNNAQSADIIVRGSIIRYRTRTTAFDQRAATEEDVELSIVVQAENPGKQQPLWRETIKASAAFYLGPDLTLNRSAQDRAIEEASASFANILIGQLLGRYEAQQRKDKKNNSKK